MTKGDVTAFIRNPHQGDIGHNLLARLLSQAGYHGPIVRPCRRPGATSGPGKSTILLLAFICC
jgi:hypothetical protein